MKVVLVGTEVGPLFTIVCCPVLLIIFCIGIDTLVGGGGALLTSIGLAVCEMKVC